MPQIRYYADGSNNYIGPLDLDTGVDVSTYMEVPNPTENPPPLWDGTKFVSQLEIAILKKIDYLKVSYRNAINQSVAYTSIGGVTKMYQANELSQYNLLAMSTAYAAGTPDGFYWLAEDDTKVPFILEDIKALAKIVGDQGWEAFQRLQIKKIEVFTTSSISGINTISW